MAGATSGHSRFSVGTLHRNSKNRNFWQVRHHAAPRGTGDDIFEGAVMEQETPSGRQMLRYVVLAAVAGAVMGWLAAWLQIPIN